MTTRIGTFAELAENRDAFIEHDVIIRTPQGMYRGPLKYLTVTEEVITFRLHRVALRNPGDTWEEVTMDDPRLDVLETTVCGQLPGSVILETCLGTGETMSCEFLGIAGGKLDWDKLVVTAAA